MKKVLLWLMLVLISTSVMALPKEKVVLSKDNTVVLFGPISEVFVSPVVATIKKLDSNLKSGYPIYLFLNTPGGEIELGIEFITFVNSLNRPVYTITKFAASMGFQIAQNLGKRFILPYGILMSHKARGGFSGEFGDGLSQLDSRYSMWLRLINRLDRKTVSRTNGKQTLKSYRAAYENELWLNGSEAVNKGYADAVANVKCDTTLLKNNRFLHVNLRGHRLEAEFEGCPLYGSVLSVNVMILTNSGEMTVDDFIKEGGSVKKSCIRKKQILFDYNSNKTVINPELCSTKIGFNIKKALLVQKEYFNMFKNIKGSVNKYRMMLR